MNVDSILQEIGAMKTKMNKKEKIVKTPEEAIETIKSNMPTSGYQMLRESLIMAIGVLEKQIPKQPRDIEYDYSYFICDNCGAAIYVGDEFDGHHYCLNCGQAIEWPDMNLEGMEDENT